MMIWLLACAEDEVVSADPGTKTDPTGETTTSIPQGDGCRATPTAEDRPVLAALPYTPAGAKSDAWARLDLTADGTLTDSGIRFEMGRATAGLVRFTPDGSLGMSPTEDGGLAVYDTVADAVVGTFDLGIYVVDLAIDTAGETALLIDGNWPENGGGLYRSTIDCTTGQISAPEKILDAKMPQSMVPTGDGWWLTGREIPGAGDGADVAQLDADLNVIGGVDAFGDEEAIVSSAALAGDYLLIGDINEFSSTPTRIAQVDTTTGSATTTEFEDPFSMLPFPDGSARALVASGYGDRYAVFDGKTGTETPVSAASVQLPGGISAATWGALRGHVVGAEIEGVRHLRIGDTVEDLGVVSLESGVQGLIGAVGVAP